jgi:RNA polymerase sigma-70 factor, ECF subfamily
MLEQPAGEVGAAGERWSALFELESARLWRALVAYTAGRADIADDAVAEAFARGLAAREPIRDPVAWLYRVAFRHAAALLRGERATTASAAVMPLPPRADARIDADHRADAAALFRALAGLSAGQRAAVVLHHHLGLPVADVAARLGCSPVTVRVQLHRARRRLRDALAEEAGDA